MFSRCITRIRLSSHNVCIESGRYYGINRNNRNCSMCDLNEVEDEFHSILQCSKYSQTCVKRSPSRQRKSDLIRQVTS